tara:strand:- start:58 stop:297 length:240 start_codon:yes stop_codon:yes gene_type:complete
MDDKYDIPNIPKDLDTYRQSMWFTMHMIKQDVKRINGDVQEHEKQIAKLETQNRIVKGVIAVLGALLVFGKNIKSFLGM